MSVVQRCPQCGTTGASPGECEACHQAQVRYFCTNHAPGIWLDASACAACGARFGEPARRAAPPAATTPVRKRAPTSPPMDIPTAPRSPYSPEDPATGAWDSLVLSPPPDREELEVGASASGLALWQRLLAAAARAPSLSPSVVPESRPPEPFLGGCLMRLMLLVVLMIIALAGAVYLFGPALLQAL